MPKTKRDFLKRQVAQAVNHIEEAQIDLLALKETFAEVHPKQTQMLEVILQSLELSITFIGDFCMATWNTIPPSWQSWRNPGHPAPEAPDAQELDRKGVDSNAILRFEGEDYPMHKIE
jgi:hypothetical protein